MADAKVGNKKQLQNRKKSAVKAARQAQRRHVVNMRRSKAMKEAVKDTNKLVIAKKMAEATKMLPSSYAAIDKAAKRGVISANKAARMKSALAKAVGKK